MIGQSQVGLIRASAVVGVIGALAALPLLALLSRMHPAAYRRDGLAVAVIAFVFVVAALAYAGAFRLLPDSRGRSRIAGVIAALFTYAAVSVLYWWGVVVFRGRPYELGPFLALGAFVLMGWLPTSAGWVAGWIVERWVMPAHKAPR